MTTPKQKQKPPTSLDLYRQAHELVTELEAREGATDEELDAALAEFMDGSVSKLDHHRYAIDSFNIRAKQYRAEAKRLSERARMMEGVATRIKGHAKLVLDARCELLGYDDGRKVETEHGIVYLTKRTTLWISDEDNFLQANRDRPWVTYKPVIDKRQVTQALKDGVEAPWAELVENTSITFK